MSLPPSTILIVDDDPSVRAFLTEAVSVGGYRPIVADYPAHALELIAQGVRPALVLCDVALPEMSGYELVEQLAARVPVIKVVFISAHFPDHPAILADRGRHKVVEKPARVGEILMAIAFALEQWQEEATDQRE